MKVAINKHTTIDKSFQMKIGDLYLKVDYDDVDHATVDAMVETLKEVVEKHWDSKLFNEKNKNYQYERWNKDEDLKEEYPSFEDFYHEFN